MLKLIHFPKSKKLNYLSGESFLEIDQQEVLRITYWLVRKIIHLSTSWNRLKQLTSPKGAKYENKGYSPLKKEVLIIRSPGRA
jgi:hypothetical protein